MRKAAAVLAAWVLATAAGCEGDPEAAPLAPATGGMAVSSAELTRWQSDRSKWSGYVSLRPPPGSAFPEDSEAILAPSIEGARVRVIEDPGPASDRSRQVRVRVEDGRLAGTVGVLRRDEIRPAPVSR